MVSKTSFNMYRVENCDIRRENQYDNSKASALLFEARAECVRTMSFVTKYTQNYEARVVCRKETDTIQHIVLECDSIHPNPCEGNFRFAEALGFQSNAEEVIYKAVEVTKRRL